MFIGFNNITPPKAPILSQTCKAQTQNTAMVRHCLCAFCPCSAWARLVEAKTQIRGRANFLHLDAATRPDFFGALRLYARRRSTCRVRGRFQKYADCHSESGCWCYFSRSFAPLRPVPWFDCCSALSQQAQSNHNNMNQEVCIPLDDSFSHLTGMSRFQLPRSMSKMRQPMKARPGHCRLILSIWQVKFQV